MTPASLLARKRALLALSGAAVPIPEVDVEEVPTEAPTDFPTTAVDEPRRPMAAPSAVSTGEPQQASERDYYQEALEDRRQRRLGADVTRIGGNLIEAFSGAPADREFAKTLESRADQPVVEYLKRQQEADKRRALELRGVKTPTGKPQPSTDPNSPSSKRKQLLVKATLGDVYADEEVAQMSEADADEALKYGSMRGAREVGREAETGRQERSNAERLQRAKLFAQRMDLDYEKMSQDERLALLRLGDAQAAREAAATEREQTRTEQRTVPGFEVAPGATPTPVDAQKMKDTNEAALRMQGNVADLRALHRKYGETPKGAGAELQQQKLRAIQIEAKNIAGLGALSGPDFNLMQDLSAQDVNSVGSWIRRNFAGATLEQSLQGLEQWMHTTIGATAKARGYSPKAAPAPQRKPAATTLPKDSSGQPTLDAPPVGFARVKMKDGTVLRIPVSDLPEALRDPDVVGEVK